MPSMHTLFSEGFTALNTSEEKLFIEKNYANADNISIDYGILEKAENVYVKKAAFDWNDLGTWGALYDKLEKDDAQNAIVRGLSHFKNAKGNMIFSSTDKLVVLDGIDDFIIVDKDNVLLIFPKEKEQDIKKLLGEVSNKFGNKYE